MYLKYYVCNIIEIERCSVSAYAYVFVSAVQRHGNFITSKITEDQYIQMKCPPLYYSN